MKKSFHWHLFIRLFVVTALIFYANRLIAHYLTGTHMTDRIESNIAATLERCQGEAGDTYRFFTCASKTNRDDALANVSEYFVLCTPPGMKATDSPEVLCEQSRLKASVAHDEDQQRGESVWLARRDIGGEAWWIFSLRQDAASPQILVRHQDILEYLDSLYMLRNRVIRYLSPVLVLLLSLMTLYMTRSAMQPIRQLEASVRGLSSSNLDKPLDLLPPYREFRSFVTVFEQLRERLNQSFLQARRFAADASHELRTPLTILRGNAERLIEELPTGSEAQVHMRLIGDEIERLIDITEKLLLLSRADANSIVHDMEPVRLSELVTELAFDAMAFHAGLKITSDIEPGICFVGDRSLMLQLVYNLYSNAAKYNVPDGWIRFSLGHRGDRFVLSIENPCDNIPVDLTERAFQRFYRGEAARSRSIDGVGLGLSLCQEIARLHGTDLTLEVTPHKTVIARLEGKRLAPQASPHEQAAA